MINEIKAIQAHKKQVARKFLESVLSVTEETTKLLKDLPVEQAHDFLYKTDFEFTIFPVNIYKNMSWETPEDLPEMTKIESKELKQRINAYEENARDMLIKEIRTMECEGFFETILRKISFAIYGEALRMKFSGRCMPYNLGLFMELAAKEMEMVKDAKCNLERAGDGTKSDTPEIILDIWFK